MPARSPMEAAEVVAAVLSRLDDDASPEAFYDDLCTAVCDVTGVERALVFLYDDDLRRVRVAGAHGLDRELFRETYVTPDTAPVARAALEEDRVVEVTGAEEAASLSRRFAPLVEGRRLACAPMVAAGRWVGVLLVDRPASRPPLSDDERHLLWTLGKTTALASTARGATRQAERARQLEHRLALSREVHDGVIQRLFGVSLALAGEGDLGSAERARCAEEVEAALRELRTALQRPIVRPAAREVALPDELAQLADAHPELKLTADLAAPVPPGLEHVAQAALAEGVRNARKHADATGVTVRTRRTDDTFVLEVENDGVRARPSRGGTGMGLRLLAFEALGHGGFAEFGPRDGDRWLLRLVVGVDG